MSVVLNTKIPSSVLKKKHNEIAYYRVSETRIMKFSYIDADAQNLFTNVCPWHIGKFKYKLLPMDIKISWFLMFLKLSYQSLSKIWDMLILIFYFDDFLILTNSSFKDYLLKQEMVLARLSSTEWLV
jgi:hypothetical protein